MVLIRILLLALSIGVFLTACDPVQEDHDLFCISRIQLNSGEVFSLGEMSALRNDEPWIESPHRGASIAYAENDEETMSIFMTVIPEGPIGSYVGRRETLYIPGIPRRLGTYSLSMLEERGNGRTSFDIHTYGSDVAVGIVYILDKFEDGFIAIDAYDPSTCRIQGTFAFTLIKKQGGAPYADTLRFTDGQFHTQVVTW